MRSIRSRLEKIEKVKGNSFLAIVVVSNNLSEEDKQKKAQRIWETHPEYRPQARVFPFPVETSPVNSDDRVIILPGNPEEVRKILMSFAED